MSATSAMPISRKPRSASVMARHGRLDVLMTAAGFSCGGTVLTTDPADWDAVFRTNVGGTWLWARAAVPQMQRQGNGSIITLASQLAIAGGKNNSAYIAAKGAIISLTRTMAVDFATDGIRVNAIAPGAIDTPMLRRSFARHADPGSGARSLAQPPRHEAIWQGGGNRRGRAASRQRCVFVYDRHRDGGRWRLARGMSDALIALEAQVRADLARIAHPACRVARAEDRAGWQAGAGRARGRRRAIGHRHRASG